MKFKILAVLQWFFAFFFASIMIGAILKGNIPVPEDESDSFLVVWYIGLTSGFLMAGIAIYVLVRLGMKNFKK